MDTDDLHQLRIVTRRLRAAIWLSRHSKARAESGASFSQLKRRLREVGSALGKKRTLDVLKKSAKRYRLDDSALDRETKTAGKGVVRALSPKAVRRTRKLIDQARARLRCLSPSELAPAIAELIARLEELRRSHPRGAEEWHRARIQIKKIRYTLEVLGLETRELKILQDVLGNAHDLEVAMEKFGRLARIRREASSQRKRAESNLTKLIEESEKRLFALRSA